MSRQLVKALDTPVCRYLRAKNPYGSEEGGENPWYDLDRSNTIFWCVRTQGPVGPDGGYAGLPKCTEGRRCYAAPRVEE